MLIDVNYASKKIKEFCEGTNCNDCILYKHYNMDNFERPCWDIRGNSKNSDIIIENYNYLLSQEKIKGDKIMSKELVNHPQHYNREGRKECWDEMIEKFGPAAVAIFDVLSAYKYHYRAGEKDGNPEEQYMAKINNYMNHSADLLATTRSNGLSIMDPTALDKAVYCYKTMKKELQKDG